MRLDDFIGHEAIRLQLHKAIMENKLAHAHIFAGEDGIGKSILCEEAALTIMGETKLRENPDIYKFKNFKNKNSIGVDEVREIVQEINKKPTYGDKKVIIIYNGDKMTDAAANAFLKTIEEPPKGVFIFILCENLTSILDTIKSRCQIHKLQRLSLNEMEKIFQIKEYNLNNAEKKAALAFAEGIPGKAEAFIAEGDYKEIRENTLILLKEVYNTNKWDYLQFESFLTKNKNRIEDVFTILISFVRDAIIYKETGNEELISNVDKLSSIKEIASLFSFKRLNDIINVVSDTRSKLRSNVNSSIAFDVMLLTMQEELYGNSRRSTF